MQPQGGPAPQAQPNTQPAPAMDANVYLAQANQRYESLRSAITNLTSMAAEQGRDLAPEETRSINEMSAQAQSIRQQIDSLTDAAVRDAHVQMRRAQLDQAMFDAQRSAGAMPTGPAAGQPTGVANGRPQGGAQAQDRDPGLYIRSGEHSYIGDHYRASRGDREAAERISRHSNALRDNVHLRDVLGAGATTFGLGLVPPVWLAELFAPIMHRRLRAAAVVQQFPWPGSPFAWSIPMAGTAATGTVQNEGVNSTESDPSYTVLSVTPKFQNGFSEVSRQMLDASNPAVDTIIWNDMIGNFFDNCETTFIADLTALAGVNTVTISAGTASTTDLLNQRTGLLNAIAAISDNNAGDASFFIGRNSRWVTYLGFQDANGRPLIVAQQYGPQNATGAGDQRNAYRNPRQGVLESVEAVTSPTVAASTGFVVNGDELYFSYSPPVQFAFEQPAGPALVRIGVYGYSANIVGRRPKAITKITYSGS